MPIVVQPIVDRQSLTDVVALVRRTFPAGRQVRFLGFGEPEPTKLPLGAQGTVIFVDTTGTVHVDWDTGVRLGMVVVVAGRRRPDRIVPVDDRPN